MNLFKEETLQHKLISKWSTLVFLSLLIAPAGYIIRAIISNDLTVEEVGIFYSVLGLVSILLAYSGLGFNESFKYFFPRFWINWEKGKGKVLLILFFISQVFMASILAFLMWKLSGWLATSYFHFPAAQPTIQLFAIFLVVVRTLTVFIYFFETVQDVFWAKFVEFVRMRVSVVWVVYIWRLGQWTLSGYTFWRLIGGIAALILAIFVFRSKFWIYFKDVHFPPLNQLPPLLKDTLRYGFYSLIAVQGSLLLGSIDQQIVVYFLGSKQAGYYTTFLSVLFLHWIITGPLFSFLFPLTSELISKKQVDRLKLLLNLLYRYFSLLGIFVGLAYFLLGDAIIYSLFGAKYLPAAFLLKIASMFVFVNMVIFINFNILSGLGKVKERALIIWWVAIWNVISDIVFVYLWGLPGVVYSTLVWWIIFLIWTYKIVSKELKRSFRIDGRFLFVNLGGLLLRWFLVYWFCGQMECVNISRWQSLEYVLLWGAIGVLILGIINLKSLKQLKDLILTVKKWT